MPGYDGIYAPVRAYRQAVDASVERMVSGLRLRLLNGPLDGDTRSHLQFVQDLKDEHEAAVKAARVLMLEEVDSARRLTTFN